MHCPSLPCLPTTVSISTAFSRSAASSAWKSDHRRPSSAERGIWGGLPSVGRPAARPVAHRLGQVQLAERSHLGARQVVVQAPHAEGYVVGVRGYDVLRALPPGEARLDDLDGALERLGVAVYAAPRVAPAGVARPWAYSPSYKRYGWGQPKPCRWLHGLQQKGVRSALGHGVRSKSGQSDLQSHSRHFLQAAVHIIPQSPLVLQVARLTQMLLFWMVGWPRGSSVQLRLTSSATVCWVRPIVRAIQAMRSPLFSPRYIASLSSYVSGRGPALPSQSRPTDIPPVEFSAG